MVTWYTKRLNKRGDEKVVTSGGSAAALVALITLVIVVYVLFLPPDIREDLLENDTRNLTGDGGSSDVAERLIFEESPRTLDDIDFDEIEHYIPSVNLYSTTSAEEIKRVDSLYVKYGVFDKSFADVDFQIENLDTTSDVMLSFNIVRQEGKLRILVNGEEVLNKEVTGSSESVIIEKRYLDYENKVEFQVDDVGWAFWTTNEYELENLLITADVTDVSNQESSSVFTLTEEEKENLERATLRFFPDCSPGQVGALEVFINSESIFSSVPDCGTLRPLEFSKDILREGENRIVFRTTLGNYLIDQIQVKTELEEPVHPIYYFEISEQEYEDVTAGELEANVTFLFLDDVELKQLKVYVNGHRFGVSTYDKEYSRTVDVYLREGSNAMRIEPEDRIDIVEVRLELLEPDD